MSFENRPCEPVVARDGLVRVAGEVAAEVSGGAEDEEVEVGAAGLFAGV